MMTEKTARKHLRRLYELRKRLRALPEGRFCPDEDQDGFKEGDCRTEARIDTGIDVLEYLLGIQNSYDPVSSVVSNLSFATEYLVGTDDRRRRNRSQI